MPRPLAEMLGALEELMNKYSAFQRSRPDLPQGNLCELSQDKLEQLVAAFQLRKSEQDKMGPEERPPRHVARAIQRWLGHRSITALRSTRPWRRTG
jgi:hypothetical protein